MERFINILRSKQHKISIIAVTAFAVALCCIFVFAGNDSSVDETALDSSLEASENVSAVKSGEGIFIDGAFVVALDTNGLAYISVSDALDARAAALGIDASAELSFVNSVEIVHGEYPVESFTDSASATALLSVDDNLVSITGEVLSIKLSVSSVSTLSESVVLEHETKIVYTDSMRDGTQKVNVKGFDGEGLETYRIVAVDGVETERTFVSLEVTNEPITEEIRVGTRSSGMNIASLKRFIKPYDAPITSYMGPRWGRTHNGIDIAKNGCYGDPVVAAGDGVVVRADWYNGYGQCVIIDHGDGVRTLYSHFSKIAVEVGETVSAGDYIGNVGATGNVTGPHLHFEVHVDGERVNPLIFVDYD